jgi:hypothetical protein
MQQQIQTLNATHMHNKYSNQNKQEDFHAAEGICNKRCIQQLVKRQQTKKENPNEISRQWMM